MALNAIVQTAESRRCGSAALPRLRCRDEYALDDSAPVRRLEDNFEKLQTLREISCLKQRVRAVSYLTESKGIPESGAI
jgi:hypothetical protein